MKSWNIKRFIIYKKLPSGTNRHTTFGASTNIFFQMFEVKLTLRQWGSEHPRGGKCLRTSLHFVRSVLPALANKQHYWLKFPRRLLLICSWYLSWWRFLVMSFFKNQTILKSKACTKATTYKIKIVILNKIIILLRSLPAENKH